MEYEYTTEIKRIENCLKLGKNDCFVNANDSPSRMHEIRQLILDRMEVIMDNQLSLYEFGDGSKKMIKAVYIDHSNDFFSLPMRIPSYKKPFSSGVKGFFDSFENYNDDRDMTGRIRIEVATDWLKLRLFNSRKDGFLNLNSRNWYSYQGLFIGGEGYTPYLRDTLLFNTDTSYQVDDRPYASYTYFGWAKYRISRLGKARINIEFKVGTIGSETLNVIQSLIHRDITVSSVKPNGWDAQIATGGRLAVSSNLFVERMIFYNQINKVRDKKKNILVYPSIIGRLNIGHDVTSIGLGVNLSTSDFRHRGGWNIPFFTKNKYRYNDKNDKKTKNKDLRKLVYKNTNLNLIWNVKSYVEFVQHNSFLEGYGVLKTLDEEFTRRYDSDDSPKSLYFLDGDDVNRTVWINEFSLGVNFRNVNLFYKQAIWSQEYRLPVNFRNDYVLDASIKSYAIHNKHQWNHVGTIGLVFKLK